eukprot:928066-Pleurochrysis_carterae.AAC.1
MADIEQVRGRAAEGLLRPIRPSAAGVSPVLPLICENPKTLTQLAAFYNPRSVPAGYRHLRPLQAAAFPLHHH